MIPVDNLLQPDEKKLEFRWKSKKTIYSLIFLFFGSIESAVGMRRFVRLGFNIHFTEKFLFLITAMVKAVLMFQLGRKWKKIMMEWRSCENIFLNTPFVNNNGWRLRTKLRFVATIFLILMLGELMP